MKRIYVFSGVAAVVFVGFLIFSNSAIERFDKSEIVAPQQNSNNTEEVTTPKVVKTVTSTAIAKVSSVDYLEPKSKDEDVAILGNEIFSNFDSQGEEIEHMIESNRKYGYSSARSTGITQLRVVD